MFQFWIATKYMVLVYYSKCHSLIDFFKKTCRIRLTKLFILRIIKMLHMLTLKIMYQKILCSFKNAVPYKTWTSIYIILAILFKAWSSTYLAVLIVQSNNHWLCCTIATDNCFIHCLQVSTHDLLQLCNHSWELSRTSPYQWTWS